MGFESKTPDELSGTSFKARVYQLYFGDSKAALRFRLGLLAFDVLTMLFFIVSSMMEPNNVIYVIDYCIAAVLTLDFWARAVLEKNSKHWLLRFNTYMDIVVIGSLLVSMITSNLSFLRVFRTLRLLRSYHVMRDMRKYSPWFSNHQEVIRSSSNLFVFIFFISACVYVMEGGGNSDIKNYLDAMYFTITTLTTTGYGDVTMKDSSGRLLSIVIMVVGVTLFLRLVRTIFRPEKTLFSCPDCGLIRHDYDAVHCKHCGRVINITSEGF